MEEQIKNILKKQYGYDFESDFFTDDILIIIDDVINATITHFLTSKQNN